MRRETVSFFGYTVNQKNVWNIFNWTQFNIKVDEGWDNFNFINCMNKFASIRCVR